MASRNMRIAAFFGAIILVVGGAWIYRAQKYGNEKVLGLADIYLGTPQRDVVKRYPDCKPAPADIQFTRTVSAKVIYFEQIIDGYLGDVCSFRRGANDVSVRFSPESDDRLVYFVESSVALPGHTGQDAKETLKRMFSVEAIVERGPLPTDDRSSDSIMIFRLPCGEQKACGGARWELGDNRMTVTVEDGQVSKVTLERWYERYRRGIAPHP